LPQRFTQSAHLLGPAVHDGHPVAYAEFVDRPAQELEALGHRLDEDPSALRPDIDGEDQSR